MTVSEMARRIRKPEFSTATYYARKDGNDNNSRLSPDAFLTLQKLQDQLAYVAPHIHAIILKAGKVIWDTPVVLKTHCLGLFY
ncbi:MAG: hypothetical protein LBV23_05985 [Deltaproteobacteria bacterium]|jgi:hypothetical protein|nr:hypothetical protein [Deltaproteobacteria bacterium]